MYTLLIAARPLLRYYKFTSFPDIAFQHRRKPFSSAYFIRSLFCLLNSQILFSSSSRTKVQSGFAYFFSFICFERTKWNVSFFFLEQFSKKFFWLLFTEKENKSSSLDARRRRFVTKPKLWMRVAVSGSTIEIHFLWGIPLRCMQSSHFATLMNELSDAGHLGLWRATNRTTRAVLWLRRSAGVASLK